MRQSNFCIGAYSYAISRSTCDAASAAGERSAGRHSETATALHPLPNQPARRDERDDVVYALQLVSKLLFCLNVIVIPLTEMTASDWLRTG